MTNIIPSIGRMLALSLTATAFHGMAAPAPVESAYPGTHRIPGSLTYFGERPSWSPDGGKIAFMSKSYGDAFEIDLETKDIKLLTGTPNPGYLRVQYLPNGDYFLIGARTFEDATTTRENNMEMWVLKQGEREPVALGHKIWEGVAISANTTRIAWANTHGNYPDRFAENENAISVADIVYDDDGQPALANEREVLRATEPECKLEPQDFRNNDTELIYTCYDDTDFPTGGTSSGGNVRGINLETGEVIIYRHVVGEYNEVEGIYPGGRYTLVESTRDNWQANNGTRAIDLWRMSLEPNSTDFVRLTFLGDSRGDKAGNPVVSPDGRTMAFSRGRIEDAAGVGYGILLLPLE